jgi:hypothetical protein
MVDTPSNDGEKPVHALRVRQWIETWSTIAWNEKEHRRRPSPFFYVFSMSASRLKRLSGIQRRGTEGRELGTVDPRVQRRHEKERSEEIRQFVQYGYPWSTFGPKKRQGENFDELGKPGWLPTAIVVNILRKDDRRQRSKVHPDEAIELREVPPGVFELKLPEGSENSTWVPKSGHLHPIEIIDGQHRLWAFEDYEPATDYELPVVAYHGLDISWQAYLFWTINIKPKRLNQSFAFDLYPLLRKESWLEKAGELPLYRETRAQELVEALNLTPDSPWYRRVNMLGESGKWPPMVSQAAWVRGLTSSYLRLGRGKDRGGGLFASPISSAGIDEADPLPWSRAQEAAFLIHAFQLLESHVKANHDPWAAALREQNRSAPKSVPGDAAFTGEYSLLTADQGVRAVLSVVNDIFYERAEKLLLAEWKVPDEDAGAIDAQAVKKALGNVKRQSFEKDLDALMKSLSTFDWRTYSFPNLSREMQQTKAGYRGSSGYKDFRRDLLEHVGRSGGENGKAANKLLQKPKDDEE